MGYHYKLKTAVLLVSVFMLAATTKAQVASDKAPATLISKTTKERLRANANANNRPRQTNNVMVLPSSKPLPPKATEAKIKHNQLAHSNPRLPDNELKKRLPSNSFKLNQTINKRPKLPPQPVPVSD